MDSSTFVTLTGVDSTTNRSRLTSIQFKLTGILLEQMQSAKAEINQSLEPPQVKLDTAQARVDNHDFDRGM
jgi:hypothetical protein